MNLTPDSGSGPNSDRDASLAFLGDSDGPVIEITPGNSITVQDFVDECLAVLCGEDECLRRVGPVRGLGRHSRRS